MSWAYRGDDAGIRLFDACLRAGAKLNFTPGMRVLDLACHECDWMEHAAKAWPDVEFVGVDWRAKPMQAGNIEKRQGNALLPETLEPESFDAIVSLSAIEHFGLGHYAHDPLDPEGDTKVVANCWRWLKPGGWLYFDVPYDPTEYRVQGTKCRVYDTEAVLLRLNQAAKWEPKFLAHAEAANAGKLVPWPSVPVKPFHYVAMVWQKA